MLLFITSVFLFKNVESQNLIQNGSFENYTNIDCTYGGFDNGNPPYNHVLDNWFGYQTPDYYNAICNALGWFNAPDNYFGFNQTKNGNAYTGLVTYARGGYDKEYIYQQLSQPLQSGKVYCLSFYVNRADRFTYAIKNIGALFTNSLPSTSNIFEINAIPQVVHTGGFISDTTQWTEIQGCFTANGGEQYITIGNFTTNFNTDTLNTNSTNLVPGREGTSYYYIDDITLIDQTTVGIKEISNLSEVVRVYPNPANDILNFQFSYAEEKRKVELFDAIGNLVLENDASSNNLSLTTDKLSNGVYFYTILVGEKTIKTDKIVIIK
ncbi:MAG: T9SS type A sorting domain-containing protein [Bacteroidetes bacterium]|nr:T9SS type A sorting domain-containing protein [Bacteroidota bacterium]